MNKLLSTTALVVALGLPTLTLAQTQAPAANPTQQQNAVKSGFLDQRNQSDLFASELMGHDAYARKTASDATRKGAGTPGMATMTSADLDGTDNIGQINEIVLSNDGRVRALGIGVSQASLNYDELTILSTDGYKEVRVYVDATKEQIQTLPQYKKVTN